MYYPVRIPKCLQFFFPRYMWRGETKTGCKRLYLTFDDGPIPEITPWVLEQLGAYNAKATFFCVGANVQKNQEIYQQILREGHQVGNHTFNHLNGWSTTKEAYLNNVAICSAEVVSPLFRPPYGRLKWGQAKALHAQYKIVLWEVLAGDFDASISGEKCWQNICRNASDGSIIVLHDSKKSWKHLSYVLPKLLDYYHNKGFTFEAISTKLT